VEALAEVAREGTSLRSLHLPIAAMLVVALLGSNSPKEYDDRAQDGAIEGDWLLVRVEICGTTMDAGPYSPCISRGGKFRWAGQDEDTGTYSVDNRFRPARLTEHTTITDSTYTNIYAVDGNTLRVAYFRPGKEGYPPDFNDRTNLLVEV
jgi:uncharacterized protein (TIGR03067 family)